VAPAIDPLAQRATDSDKEGRWSDHEEARRAWDRDDQDACSALCPGLL